MENFVVHLILFRVDNGLKQADTYLYSNKPK